VTGSWRELGGEELCDWHCSPVSGGRRWVRNIARMEMMRNYKDFSRQA